jgi:uncharacterized membrane protein YadS
MERPPNPDPLIAAVLAAIGTSLIWRQVLSSGSRPLLCSGVLGLILGVTSLEVQITAGGR